MLIDIRSLLAEREDCDAGTVQQLRNALAQGKTQYRSLREVNDLLKKKLETAARRRPKLHLKLGIANFFIGHLNDAIELCRPRSALASFYLGKQQREARPR
ncbi:MAG: hypothetical protein U0793_15840 [Gemmataceae bacterium]